MGNRERITRALIRCSPNDDASGVSVLSSLIAVPVGYAHVAQLVEHTLGKGEVIGSIPIVSSAGEVEVRDVKVKVTCGEVA